LLNSAENSQERMFHFPIFYILQDVASKHSLLE
jgi:hypothetical protein